MKKMLFSVVMALCLLYACEPKQKTVDIQTETNILTDIENQWVAANQARDIEKNMSYYTENSVIMHQGIPIIKGLDSIRKYIESGFADTTVLWNTFNWKTEQIDVSASADMAVVRGTYSFQVKTPDGVNELTGKGIEIFRKVNNEWKASTSIYNSDK